MRSILPKSKKTCKQCSTEKSINDFSPSHKDNPTGKRKSICRDCDNANNKERYEKRKANLSKECAYQDCHQAISSKSSYCQAHFQFSPEQVAKRTAKKLPPKICAHPDCDKELSRNAKDLCFYHFNRRERDQETIDKMSQSAQTRANTEEGRARMARATEIQREHWSNGTRPRKKYSRETPEQRQQRLANWIIAGKDAAIKKQGDTSIEIAVSQILDKAGVQYVRQKRIGCYAVDFYIPSCNTILEANGCYWHGCEQCGYNSPQHLAKRQREQIRTEMLKNKGYAVVVLWEHDIVRAMQDNTYTLQLDI